MFNGLSHSPSPKHQLGFATVRTTCVIIRAPYVFLLPGNAKYATRYCRIATPPAARVHSVLTCRPEKGRRLTEHRGTDDTGYQGRSGANRRKKSWSERVSCKPIDRAGWNKTTNHGCSNIYIKVNISSDHAFGNEAYVRRGPADERHLRWGRSQTSLKTTAVKNISGNRDIVKHVSGCDGDVGQTSGSSGISTEKSAPYPKSDSRLGWRGLIGRRDVSATRLDDVAVAAALLVDVTIATAVHVFALDIVVTASSATRAVEWSSRNGNKMSSSDGSNIVKTSRNDDGIINKGSGGVAWTERTEVLSTTAIESVRRRLYRRRDSTTVSSLSLLPSLQFLLLRPLLRLMLRLPLSLLAISPSVERYFVEAAAVATGLPIFDVKHSSALSSEHHEPDVADSTKLLDHDVTADTPRHHQGHHEPRHPQQEP